MSKELTGIVVSNKMTKSLVIRVTKKYRHPKYGKVIIRHKKYKAHNEVVDISVGDTVTIKEVRPISKHIKFTVVEKVNKTNNSSVI